MKTTMHADSARHVVHHRTIVQDTRNFRESLLRSLAEHQVVAIEGDDSSLAAFMTGIVAEKTIAQCHWSVQDMSESQTTTLWLLMLALTDELCKRLDIIHDQTTMYAAMYVFRHSHDYLFGSLQREMQQRYRYMARARTSQLTINQLHAYIRNWLSREDFANNRELARIVALLMVCCRRIHTLVSEQVITVDSTADSLIRTGQST